MQQVNGEPQDGHPPEGHPLPQTNVPPQALQPHGTPLPPTTNANLAAAKAAAKAATAAAVPSTPTSQTSAAAIAAAPPALASSLAAAAEAATNGPTSTSQTIPPLPHNAGQLQMDQPIATSVPHSGISASTSPQNVQANISLSDLLTFVQAMNQSSGIPTVIPGPPQQV